MSRTVREPDARDGLLWRAGAAGRDAAAGHRRVRGAAGSARCCCRRFIKPGTVSTTPYNHYSTLRLVEDLFGLEHLGYAGQNRSGRIWRRCVHAAVCDCERIDCRSQQCDAAGADQCGDDRQPEQVTDRYPGGHQLTGREGGDDAPNRPMPSAQPTPVARAVVGYNVADSIQRNLASDDAVAHDDNQHEW